MARTVKAETPTALDKHSRSVLRESINLFKRASREGTGLWLSCGELRSHAGFMQKLLEALDAASQPRPDGG